MRRSFARAAFLIAACIGVAAHAADDAPKQSRWSIVWQAMRDAVAGTPDASALAERRHFEGAGIAFDYPAPLHVTKDPDGDLNWTLTYGDFDLDVYAYAEGAVGAAEYLGALSSALDTRNANIEKPDGGEPVRWCGREIVPVRLRLSLFGDRHDFRGYDLPAPDGETRFLVFDDVLEGGRPSKQAEAAFALVSETLRCAATGAVEAKADRQEP